MQPDRRGAGAAVEHERDRPLGHVGVVEGVRRDRQLGTGLPALEDVLLDLLLAQHHPAGSGGVGDLAGRGLQGVMGDDEVVDRFLLAPSRRPPCPCRASLNPAVPLLVVRCADHRAPTTRRPARGWRTWPG